MIVTLLMPSQVLLCSGLEKYSRSGAWEHWTGLGTWSLAAISDTGVGHSKELGDKGTGALEAGSRS